MQLEVTMEFSNELEPAELERLALLSEEMGEAQQVIGKIIRHGYESWDPTGKVQGTNREQLVREIGDVTLAISLLYQAEDISHDDVDRRVLEKSEKVKQYLHHQA
jgi:NTP pyrophosphatase (non-canonical NTP hydrolase)